ncbi:MAG: hypothetical protein F7C08_02895 [Desulfurococcales archaeon]|nr:hypothetical protein [Desulfurococcales archaeon]MCE4605462.1 hypothetical protein [Desulfurococcales archaeon]
MPRRRDILDYRVAQTIEALTRRSTEDDEASPAIRWYARYIGTGERNLYKLVQRALSYGFKFGISLNYERIGINMLITIGDTIDLDLPMKMSAKTLDGKELKMFYMPLVCMNDVIDKLSRENVEYYLNRILWGSRPALASIPFLDLKPVSEISGETEEKMTKIAAEIYQEGPPRIWGRRYPLDKVLLAILDEADEDSIKSMAAIARELGIETPKAQRKYYNMWSRRVILGYRLRYAPYFGRNHVLAVVSTPEPLRLSYALPVLPPVVFATVSPDPVTGRERVIVSITGEGDMISSTLRIVKKLGGNIDTMYYYYEVDKGKEERLSKKILSMPGDLECPH